MEGMVGEPDHLRLLDLFSGIGGFHLGLERAGHKIGWSGFCEIDKYASAVYKRRFPDAQELGDIRAIQPERDLPDHIDVLCGGFPCQSFSIAGKRRSFEDTRGTLFFEIARILKYYRDVGRPISYFILENVKGLYSAGDHSVLPTIYGILTDLDYTVESQLLNTRWVLPQNRERIYIVGHIRKRGGSKIFPIGEGRSIFGETQKVSDYTRTITTAHSHGTAKHMSYIKTGLTIGKDSEASRVYDIARTIKNGGGMGAKTGLYKVDTGNTQAVEITNYGPKNLNETLQQNDLKEDDVKALDLYNRKAQDVCPALTEPHHNNLRLYEKSKIRRLTPKECERLQGFPDDWTSEGIIDGEIVKMSDTQRYKQCGNAVTVDIVSLVAKRLKHELQ